MWVPAPWLTRWISPDAAGAVDGLNFYVYVGNNPLKYIEEKRALIFNAPLLSSDLMIKVH
jgi:uncharacterized protein RhaS with RHS repeats